MGKEVTGADKFDREILLAWTEELSKIKDNLHEAQRLLKILLEEDKSE